MSQRMQLRRVIYCWLKPAKRFMQHGVERINDGTILDQDPLLYRLLSIYHMTGSHARFPWDHQPPHIKETGKVNRDDCSG
jgi:hypothetical protein